MKIFLACCLTTLSLISCGEGSSGQGNENVCDDSTDTVPFELGMVLTSNEGQYSLKIEAADPNPVDRGLNTLTVVIYDADGNAIPDAAIVLEPSMPGHGHGTFPPTFEGTRAGADGSYEFGPFDLMMPGTWLLTFTVTDSANITSIVTVAFCVES